MSNKFIVTATLAVVPFVQASPASDAVDLGEITISTASRFSDPVSSVLAPTSVLTREEIEKLGANSLVDALKTLPGIEIGQSGGRGQTASIFLRGTNSNHTLVLIDGVRLAATMLNNIDFSSLPLNMIERIEVIRGSGATVYGSDAIGGVINIITRTDKEGYRFSFGTGSMSSNSANFGITQALTDKLSLQVMGGIEQTEGYNVQPDAAPAQDEHGFDGKNLSARLAYQPNDSWKINLYSSVYKNEGAYHSGSKIFGFVDNRTLGSDINFLANNWQHLLKVEYNEQKRYQYSSHQSANDENLNYEISQLFANYSSRVQLAENFSLTAGADLSLEELLFYSSFDVKNIENNPRRNIGVYALANWQLYPNWSLEASSRYDNNEQYGGNTSGQVALGWDINESYRIFASIGTAFKAPTFVNLYSSFGGNPKLKPEESLNYELGIDGFHRYFDWSVNAYQNDVDNLISYNRDLSLNENIAKAQLRGLEFSAGFDLGLLNNKFSLEFRDPLDKISNKQLARRAKRVAKWQGSIEFNQWLFGAQLNYQSERPDWNKILPSYSVWDLTAQYPVTKNLVLRGKIANAFDKKYETASGYPMAERAYYINADFTF